VLRIKATASVAVTIECMGKYIQFAIQIPHLLPPVPVITMTPAVR
jgi:hypothetical protein